MRTWSRSLRAWTRSWAKWTGKRSMYGADFEKTLTELESRYPEDRKRAALLMALHAVQAEKDYVPEDAIHWLAARYSISAADVSGVISFYTMFFDENPGKHVIWLCRTFSCELRFSVDT